MKKGLVSILIPNYNYSRYLRNCLDSVLNQTYDNIEVIFRDNCSTDDSLDVAQRYIEKFKQKGIPYSVSSNKYNLGSASNSIKCYNDSQGDYIIYLSSDDAIKPDFVEKCVSVFEKNPDVGMVMTHRDEIDENGNVTETPPFYNQSCVIDGEAQAAVFMMSGIAVPSQCMMRLGYYVRSTKGRTVPFQICGDWYNNFMMSCCSDIAYIKEPLCLYRVHSGNETNISEENLLGIFEHYQLINMFKGLSENYGMHKPLLRYNEAVEKLGSMCLRYALKMLKNNKNNIANKYLMLAPIFKQDIVNDENYNKLKSYINLNDEELKNAIFQFEAENNLNRVVSYDPPEGFIAIDI